MHWFHSDTASGLSSGGLGELDGQEASHAISSLRIRVGEEICITDGLGAKAVAFVTEVTKKTLRYEVSSMTIQPKPPVQIWLYQALAKGDRDELAVQMATELGVAGVAPWQAVRSVSRWEGDKVAKGLARWRSISIEASKQSHRPWFPLVESTAHKGLPRYLPGQTIMLEPTAKQRLSDFKLRMDERINLIVGPEGGFEESELIAAEEYGYQIAKLGQEVLRTSTAGPAAIALINGLVGYW